MQVMHVEVLLVPILVAYHVPTPIRYRTPLRIQFLTYAPEFAMSMALANVIVYVA